MRYYAKLASILLFLAISYLHGQNNSIWSQTERLQSGRNWDEFIYPTVTIVDKDQGQTQGSQIVHRLFPNLSDDIKDIAKGVCKLLYKDVSEVPYFEELQFELEYRDGVAYKAGNPPKITVNLSTQYLENQYSQQGDDGIIYEINGVNWHELTHAYQYVPQNCGGYASGTEFFGFIEGTADAVRILAGYHSSRTPSPGGSWTSGYTTTGFFIEWLVNNYDTDFLYKLNQSCKTIDPWSYNSACTEILGKGVQTLWDEYQWYLKNGGNEAVAEFKAEATLICQNQSIQFTNRSFNNPVSYEWTFEGGTPSTSIEKDPIVTYSVAGNYNVILKAINSDGSTIKKKDNYITVINESGEINILTEPEGDISSEFQSPFGEVITNLIDENINTKYCVKESNLWIMYNCRENEELYAYSFTSANDASWRDPEEWTLHGSTDSITWSTIDTQRDIIFENRLETQLFVVNSAEKFKYYKWNIKSKNDTLFQMAELVMYGIDRNTTLFDSKISKEQIRSNLINSSLYISIPQDYRGKFINIYNIQGALLQKISLKNSEHVCRINPEQKLSSGFYLAEIKLEKLSEKRIISKKEHFIIK